MSSHYLKSLLQQWQQHAKQQQELCEMSISISQQDFIRTQALAEVYQLDQSQLVSDLLQHSLKELEAAMPYQAGAKVIRVEEGNPIYEDIGLMPAYLEYRQRLQANSQH